MRQTCKNNTQNYSKTRQKTSKNSPKKHNENTTTHFQPKGRQKVHIKRPTREGKGGIQDGILLEKKEYCKTRPTAGKGCMLGRLHADTPNANTPLRWAAHGPGANFSMFFGPLSAPFWSMLGPFGSIWALVGSMLGPFGSILGAFWTLLAEFCKK